MALARPPIARARLSLAARTFPLRSALLFASLRFPWRWLFICSRRTRLVLASSRLGCSVALVPEGDGDAGGLLSRGGGEKNLARAAGALLALRLGLTTNAGEGRGAKLRICARLRACLTSVAEICCEEAKSMPAAASAAAATALARRRRRVDMAVAAGFRLAGDLEPPRPAADDGVARAGKRQRLACTASGSCPRPAAGFVSRWWPRYGVTSVCGRRREMEDAVSIRPDFLPGSSSGKHHFFGVFDGHGCSHVARMCQDRLHELVVDAYKKATSAAWKEVMEKGFARMDDEAASWAASRSGDDPACRCELQTPARCDHVGSAAVVAVVGTTHIVVANAGDSRAVLSRAGVPVPLSVDHKPDRPDELERIQAAGGRVIFWDGARVLGVLAMSRAIGDGYLKPFVTAEPEVTVTERTNDDECLILASDGLWDVVTNEMACEVVRACFRSNGPPSPGGARANGVLPLATTGHRDDAGVKRVDKAKSDKACSDAALLLAKLALARRSSDNVSVVVVDLRRGP